MPVIIKNAEYAALVAAQSERDILQARIAQILAMNEMLNEKEACPNGDTFNDVISVLKHGPYNHIVLQNDYGDATFLLS